jgi:hypothetical protein
MYGAGKIAMVRPMNVPEKSFALKAACPLAEIAHDQ